MKFFYIRYYLLFIVVLFVACQKIEPGSHNIKNANSNFIPVNYNILINHEQKTIKISELGLTIKKNKLDSIELIFNRKDTIEFISTDFEKFMWMEGEFSYEFSEVMNYLFPIQGCNLLRNSDIDESVRLYIYKNNIDEIDSSIQNIKTIVPRYLFPVTKNYKPHGIPVKYSSSFDIVTSNYGIWKDISISYTNWYGDYGGTSNMRLFLYKVNGVTIVFAFTYIGDKAISKTIKDILDNIKFERIE